MSWTVGSLRQRETKPEQSTPVAWVLTAALSAVRLASEETSPPAWPVAMRWSKVVGSSKPPHL